MESHLKGLVPAVFTPMREDGSLNPDQVEPIVDIYYLTELPHYMSAAAPAKGHC